MLVVVKRSKKNNIVSVIDTDDMVIEDIDFDEAESLHLPIAGLVWKEGLRCRLRDNLGSGTLSFTTFGMDNTVLKFNHFQVYMKMPVFEEENLLIAGNGYFNFTKFFVGDLLSGYPLLYLLLVWSIVRCLYGFGIDSMKAVINGKKSEFNFSLADLSVFSIVSLVTDISLDVLFDDVGDFLELDYIRENTVHFELYDSVYLSDGKCVIRIKNKVINSFVNMNKSMVLDTKYRMIGAGSINIADGTINIVSTNRLVISNSATYVFSGRTRIGTLKITSGKARFIFKDDAEIVVYNFECTSDLNIMSLVKHIDFDYIKSFSIKKNSNNVKVLKTALKDRTSNFKIIINTFSSDSEFLKFASLLLDLKSIDDLNRRFLNSEQHRMLQNINLFDYYEHSLSDNYKDLLNFVSYTFVSNDELVKTLRHTKFNNGFVMNEGFANSILDSDYIPIELKSYNRYYCNNRVYLDTMNKIIENLQSDIKRLSDLSKKYKGKIVCVEGDSLRLRVNIFGYHFDMYSNNDARRIDYYLKVVPKVISEVEDKIGYSIKIRGRDIDFGGLICYIEDFVNRAGDSVKISDNLIEEVNKILNKYNKACNGEMMIYSYGAFDDED